MTLDPQDMGANGADTSPHPGEKSEQNTGVSGGARGGTARKARPAHREPLSLFVPWPNPVDGAELLDEIAATFKRHLVLPPGGAETMALWVLFAHTLDAHDCAPRLLLTSPTNGCGKSQAMKLIGHLVDCPYQTASATPSVVYRTIEKCGACYPTLLFDEADNAARDPTKCAILNCGHERFAAFVSVNEKTKDGDWEPKNFSTWAPMVFAWNEERTKMWPSLRARCIAVGMKRRLPSEKIERIRPGDLVAALVLGQKAARWATDHIDALRDADPDTAPMINRDADNWRPLFAVADLAGDRWPAAARSCSMLLQGKPAPEIGVELLRDIAGVFTKKAVDAIFSTGLLAALWEMEDRPWATYDKGKTMTPFQLVGLLAPFGIEPDRVRIGGEQRRGYALAWFAETFNRYGIVVTPVTAV